MSSRQRARLAASLRAERGEAAVAANSEDEHSEGSDHELQADLRPAQPSYGLLWPESSDSDSDAAEGNTSPVAKTVHAAPAHAPRNTSSKKKKKKKLVDKSSKCEQANQADMLIADEIDAAIEELELSAEPPSAAANGARSSQIAQILAVDPQGLDVDSLIRQRFAGAAADTGTDRGAGKRGARQGNAKQHVHRLGGVGRFIFGMPKDEWLKPPSYVGGGVGMAPSRPSETMGTGDPALGSRLRGSKMFQFIWADEYAIVNDQFRAIQQSGDANRLVTFLAQHHYHLEGLLQLAMVFARTGHMDRASDLVRRCLFCIHCAEAEAFRPCTATVLLDPAVYENRIYFAAVFRHMQIVGMLGCPSVAANIAKLLLSLNPFGDTAHVLLCIDYYLIAAGDASEFENLYEHAEHIIVGIDTSEKRDASESSKRPDCTRLNLTDLPNWLFSSALNAFLRSRRCGVYSKYEDSENDLKYKALSDFRLRSAIIKYPFFLHYLLPSNAISGGVGGSAVVGTASSVILPAQWKRLLSNSFFLPLPVSQSFSVLAHLGDIYRARSSTLWANRKAGGGGDFVDVEKWIYEIAVDVLREQESEYVIFVLTGNLV